MADERERVLAVLDLAAEQRGARAVATCVLEQEERVVGRAGCAAEDAWDQVRVVGDTSRWATAPTIPHMFFSSIFMVIL